MSDAAIAVEHLGHTYLPGTPMETVALWDATITLNRGKIGALVGEAGAGKTTLVHYVAGLLRPTVRGRVVVLGQDLGDDDLSIDTLRRQVGLVFQYAHQQVFERFVGDDVAFGPRRLGLSGTELRKRVRWAMSAVDLDFDEFVDRRTFSLSGGEMRRVALAGVLAMRPRLLVLDEATSGLDPRGRSQVRDLLLDLRDREAMTILMVTNDMDEAADLADTVTVLHQGRTVLAGQTREVLRETERLYEAGLMPPRPTQISQALADAGLRVRRDALTVAEVEEGLWQALTL